LEIFSGLDSLNFGLFNDIDGLGSREFSLPFVKRYEDKRYLSLLTGLGSRERGNDDVMEVIELILEAAGLGSLDFSRAVVSVDEYDFSNLSLADVRVFERERPSVLLDNESLLLLPTLRLFEYVRFNKCLSVDESV
jgi:hypothetical protein